MKTIPGTYTDQRARRVHFGCARYGLTLSPCQAGLSSRAKSETAGSCRMAATIDTSATRQGSRFLALGKQVVFERLQLRRE